MRYLLRGWMKEKNKEEEIERLKLKEKKENEMKICNGEF